MKDEIVILKERKSVYVLQIAEIILFVGILTFFMVKTAPKVLHKAMNDYESAEFAGWSNELAQLQAHFKENLALKNDLTDLASASDVAFARIFTDNYNYLKDTNGVVYHLQNDIKEPELINDIVQIQQYADENDFDTKLVYVQNPLRIDTAVHYRPHEFTNVDEYEQRAKDTLDAGGVDILDIEGQTDTYFVTDVHATTDAQVDAMRQIVEYLEAKKGLQFRHKDLLNIHNSDLYEKNSYQFIGGYCRSIGGYYTKKDTFNLYLPLFPTDYVIDFKNTGIQITGTFTDALVRIPEEYDSYSYWITNMAYYGQSVYSIKNTTMEGEPMVLFVMDSAPMTGICYLSAICSEVCVYDPRFSEGDSDRVWLKEHLKDYDAVLFDTLESSMDNQNIFD